MNHRLSKYLCALICFLICNHITADAAEFGIETITHVQELLNNNGYDCGEADGIIGNKTLEAIRNYQKEHGLETTGQITDQLLEEIGSNNTAEEP